MLTKEEKSLKAADIPTLKVIYLENRPRDTADKPVELQQELKHATLTKNKVDNENKVKKQANIPTANISNNKEGHKDSVDKLNINHNNEAKSSEKTKKDNS